MCINHSVLFVYVGLDVKLKQLHFHKECLIFSSTASKQFATAVTAELYLSTLVTMVWFQCILEGLDLEVARHCSHRCVIYL